MSLSIYNILNKSIKNNDRLFFYETRLNNSLKYYNINSKFKLLL